jgi:serine/threonine-protein kinase
MSGTGKYKIVAKLGSGGMGTVFRGLLVGQAGFQRPIVIKQLHEPEGGPNADPTPLRLFVEEARRYALLDHENIGRIFDFEDVAGRACIIMEYIDGVTLTEFLVRHRETALSVPVELAVFIVSRVCRALQYVFERAAIVHRDVSPSNIMMTREGTVKLIDFGIATRNGTRDSNLTGKPAYMAPEMIVEMRADGRSDIFSLGIVLWEMLAGERLFRGEGTAQVLGKVLSGPIPPLRSRNPHVPPAVEAIAARALERRADARYASAAEMGGACEHFLYDKGYGPTNLTLKRYLAELFPETPVADLELDELAFPELEPELIPIDAGIEAPGAAALSPELLAKRQEPTQLVRRSTGEPSTRPPLASDASESNPLADLVTGRFARLAEGQDAGPPAPAAPQPAPPREP